MSEGIAERERVVAIVEKNTRERIVVRLHTFNGHDLLGLQIQFRDEDADEWRWAKKGFSIRVDRAADLAEAVVAAMKAISPTWRPTEKTGKGETG